MELGLTDEGNRRTRPTDPRRDGARPLPAVAARADVEGDQDQTAPRAGPRTLAASQAVCAATP